MQLRQRGTEQPDINLTSLIDVVFLLLIFFMITTTFQHSTALKVALPEADSADEAQTPDTVMLTISVDGQFAIDDDILGSNDLDTVRAALASRWQQAEGATLVIHADADSAHRHVVTAMDAATAVGISSLSIAAERTDPASGQVADYSNQH